MSTKTPPVQACTPHTLGLVHTGGNGTVIYDSLGWCLATAAVVHLHRAGHSPQPDLARGNATRLAACWNWCEDMNTELLLAMNRPAFSLLALAAAERDAAKASAREALFALRDHCVGDSLLGGQKRLHAIAHIERVLNLTQGTAQ